MSARWNFSQTSSKICIEACFKTRMTEKSMDAINEHTTISLFRSGFLNVVNIEPPWVSTIAHGVCLYSVVYNGSMETTLSS